MAARGYLGKISAVVSINASSVAPTLNSAGNSINSWARRTQGTLSSFEKSAKASFDGIFTPLQRLQASLRNAVSQPLAIKDAQAARQIEQLVLSARQIAKPLADSAKQLGALSDGVQRQFTPALVGVQDALVGVRRRIEENGAVGQREFSGLADDVRVVTAAIGRLREQASLSSGLFTGEELTFARPEVVDQFRQLATAQQKLAASSSATRSSPIARELLRDGQVLSEQFDRVSARIERLSSQGLDTTISQRALELLSRRLREVIDLTEQVASPPGSRSLTVVPQPVQQRGLGLFGRQAGTQEEQAIDRARQLSQVYAALPDSAKVGLSGLASIAARLADNVQTGKSSAEQLNAVLDRLEERAKLASTEYGPTVPPGFDRIRAINEAWDLAIRQIPQTADQIDREFQGLLSRIGNFSLDDRLSLDGLIADFRNSVAAGDPLIAQFERLLRLQESVDQIAGRQQDSRFADLGRDLTDPQRQLEVLKGSITGLKGQLDTLPAGIRAQFIPAIQQAEASFIRLAALGPAATAEEIENAANEADRLGQTLRRVSQASALPTFAQALDDTALRGAIGSLQAYQQILARVGAQAGGDAARQFDAMRAAIQRAAAAGTLGSRAFAEELENLIAEAAQAAAATGRISFGAALREIRRGGDIARGGFGNLSLAAQQAAFAIDDFFSSTGDFTQKIRAVQNNVTQLAFIIGGTRGLFIGLGVAIATQAVVGLIKWINNGRTAQDQTKALNDALARQKSLVEELAQAFESLGDSIARRAFSEPAEQARAFRKELDDIAKKQRELRESRVADLDETVQRERGEQNRLSRELEGETNAGRRVALAGQIRESQRRERDRVSELSQATPPGRDDVLRTVLGTIRANEFLVGGRLTSESERRASERRARAEADFAGADSVLEQGRLLRERLAERRDMAARPLSVMAFEENPEIVRARGDVANLERTLASLELPLQKALDELSNKIIESSIGVSIAIEDAQGDVADAIRRGVKGAADFQAGLDNTAKQLEAAEQRLKAAQEIKDDPARRETEVRRAESEIRDIRNRQDAINEAAREVRLGRTFGGERSTSALSALQGSERFANQYAGLTARLTSAVDAEVAARRELEQAIASGTEQDQAAARQRLEEAQAASDLVAATAEAALAMEKAVERIRKIGADALSASENIANDAQRRLTQSPTAANRRDRDAAEEQLINDRERLAKANNAMDRRRDELLANSPGVRAVNEELEAVRQERERLAEEARINGTEADPREMERLRNREAELYAERERALYSLTEAERQQQDAIAYEIDARRRLIEQLDREREFDAEVRRRQSPEGDATRGLDLMETPAQRAARDIAQGFADINAAFDEQLRGILDSTNGMPGAATEAQAEDLRSQRDDAIRRFAADQQRAAAPAIFNLADSVANAVLQGPSRAAMNVSDISTQEGARELNRLLRGEDSARDQNLLELQKQSQELQNVNQKLAEIGRQVGVAL
jgi:hypothetical protein